MKTEQRLIFAIAISIAIMVFYPYIITKFFPQYKIAQKRNLMGTKKSAEISQEQLIIQPPAIEAPKQEEPAVAQDNIKEELIVLENDQYKIICANIGGSIKEIVLKTYIDPDTAKPSQLVAAQAGKGIFSIYNLFNSIDLAAVPYAASAFKDRVEFCYIYNNQLKIVKKIILDPSKYVINLEMEFTNLTDQNLLLGYKLICASGMSTMPGMDERYYETDTLMKDRKRFHDTIRSVKSTVLERQGEIQWTSLKSRYFSLITVPDLKVAGVALRAENKSSLANSVVIKDFNIIPYAATSHKYLLYAGPNNYNTLKAVGLGLENVVISGMFSSISKGLLWGLEFLHSIFKNWGVAIIVLSILINFLLYPLTKKSLNSMKEIQVLQPKVEELKLKYKDNAQKLNREIMELYKVHKVNPLGGCLPMLLQMPVFIALYNVLLRTIELRGAQFLWIKNLAGTDALFHLSQKLPFIGDTINILPIIMAAVMFIQQKFAPMQTAVSEEQRQQQKIMQVMMPIVFGAIFYQFPAGLVLYWLTNTVFTTILQRRTVVATK